MLRLAFVSGALLALVAHQATAQAALTTLFSQSSSGAVGGAVYFDVEVKLKTSLQALDCNFSATVGTPVGLDMYVTPDGRAGKQLDVAAWTFVSTDDGSSLAAGEDEPTRIRFPKALSLKPGRYGIALVARGTGHGFTNANASNISYADGFLALQLGEASDAPFNGTLVEERVWNGRLIYGPKTVVGPYLYTYDDVSGSVHGFLLDSKSGAPGQLLGSPFEVTGGAISCNRNCQSLVADPGGLFVFAATNAGLAVLARGAGGILEQVAGSPFAASSGLRSVAAWRSATGLQVFAVANPAGVLDVFDIDLLSGAATRRAASLSLGTGGGAGGLIAGKRFLFAANQTDSAIRGFAIDELTGDPVAMTGSPFTVPGIDEPSNLALDSKETMLAVNDCDDGDYGFLLVDKLTGELSSPLVLTGASDCSQIFGFTSKGFLYGGGDDWFDVFETGPALICSPSAPEDVELGAIAPKGSSVYFTDGRSLMHLPIHKKYYLPIAASTGTLLDVFREDPTGMIYVAK
ncbi:MAG: hypothetical protein IPN34_13060 [Planctomycetes bacterium]|nr:hypothetical protein [Planctomycetota bacterium]